jgi:hypothetical protein
LSEYVEAGLLSTTSNEEFAYSVAEQVDTAFKSKKTTVGKSCIAVELRPEREIKYNR